MIEIESNAADAHIGLAYLYKDHLNDLPKAKELYLEAIKIDASQKNRTKRQ